VNPDKIEEVTYKRIQRVRSAGWLSFTDLAFHCGVGETEMREMTKRSDFPTPSAPTGSMKLRRWSKVEVDEWMAAHKLQAVGDV
jgi:predicted DNA-binding transcriptional regulator AlpA